MFQGDSGGPLSYDHRGQHVLVGVTSYSTVKWKSELELEVESACASVSLKRGCQVFLLNCIFFMRVLAFPNYKLMFYVTLCYAC